MNCPKPANLIALAGTITPGLIGRCLMGRVLMATVLVTLALGARAEDNGKQPDDLQKGFTISYWCGPPAQYLTLERFQEVKAAHFTLAFPPCGGLSVEQNRAMLDLCQQVGIQAVIADARMVYSINGSKENQEKLDAIVKDYSDHPALLGYHIVDEPGAGAFDGLAEVVAYLKQKDPKHPGYINLLPTYAGPSALGTKTYEEYVRLFAEKVRPSVLSYDHYALTNSGDRPDFFENLKTVRDVSLASNIPFWNIVLVTQHFDYRHLTEAELRFEAMQTLAFGGKGLLWFTFWMPGGVPSPESWKHSMILADGSRDAHYEMVQRINAEVKAIGDMLANARSTSVFHHGGNDATVPMRKSPLVPTGGTLTVGIFEEVKSKKTLALVTNRDYRHDSTTHLAVEPRNAKVELFDPESKTWTAAKPDEHGAIPLTLQAGGGVLLRW